MIINVVAIRVLLPEYCVGYKTKQNKTKKRFTHI